MSEQKLAILCPGQGAQAVGMGKAWAEASSAARAVFDEADEILGDSLGVKLSELCFAGPPETLNQTNVSQPAIYTCSVASFQGLIEQHGVMTIATYAGLSLGEYTALHLGGAFNFAEGLKLVALRGKLMQEACEATKSSMVALIGADESQSEEVCQKAAGGQVLVPANFNAPGQVVISGHIQACERAVLVAEEMGLRAKPLTVAGAFHSSLMQSAADQMALALNGVVFGALKVPVWSNVTAQQHDSENPELLKSKLVKQIVSPVRWSQTCFGLVSEGDLEYHELAPGSVLKGLMRRVDRKTKVICHDEPEN